MSRAQDELDARRGRAGGKLSIGVTPWLALSFVPDAVTLFRKRVPGMQLEFYEGLLNIVMPRLRDGSLDFSLGKPGPASLHAEFVQTPIFATESAVVVRKDHPLAHAHSLAELQDCEWLLNWDPGSKDMIADDVFRRHGLPLPQTVHLAHSFIVAMGLIMNTDMVSIFPWPLVETRFARENLRALVLREEVDRTVVSVVARRGVPLPAAAECFLDCLKEAIRSGEASRDPERRRALSLARAFDPGIDGENRPEEKPAARQRTPQKQEGMQNRDLLTRVTGPGAMAFRTTYRSGTGTSGTGRPCA